MNELNEACDRLKKALSSQKPNSIKAPRLPLKRDRKVVLSCGK